ncbi:hypothetical protein [Arenimonas metalli]|uniref:Lectin n=1 Tax=Arenimonas metalli CF5-1 TaxID=1384056 RepID=A0A091BBY8_9GAMM|nr:hypothetical protein [Arenimonas metalli]KFN41915.1 hypothetical protein N787_03890 [Arenimonas metalli CF5-1]
MRHAKFLPGALLVAVLAACSAPPSGDTGADAATPGPAPAASPEPATPAAPEAPVPAQAAGPRGEHDAAVVNFRGFGPASFGDGEERVRQAWGRPLQPYTLTGTELCYYLEMDPRPPQGADESVAFMLEESKFVRYDVYGRVPAAPGGFVVGSLASDVLATFGSRVEEQPHKYLPGGRYLVVTPEYGEAARLVFEIDAEGRVVQWRIGLPPQVFYVEGCA